MGTRTHKKAGRRRVKLAILTVSSTRSLAEDESGQWMRSQAQKEGHTVALHQVVIDDARLIRDLLMDILRDPAPEVVLINGGTGISPADVTIEAVKPLFIKELTAFGALFAQLSFEQIDSAAILSRATAGVIGQAIVFCLPGSKRACQLACRELIFPELGHLVKHARDN